MTIVRSTEVEPGIIFVIRLTSEDPRPKLGSGGSR